MKYQKTYIFAWSAIQEDSRDRLRSKPCNVNLVRFFRKRLSFTMNIYLSLLQLFLYNLVRLTFNVIYRFVNHIDVEDTVWVAQKTVDLLVDEDERVEDDGDHDHEEDFAEESDVETDDVSNEVDPEDEVEEGFGKGFSHPRELVHCGEQGSISSWSRLDI